MSSRAVVVDDLGVDVKIALPLGEWFDSPGPRGLRSDEGIALVDRMVAIVRSAPGGTSIGQRIARQLRLSARVTGTAQVRPIYADVTMRDRTSGFIGPPDRPTSFGYSLYCQHTEVPLAQLRA